mmetsp:Transcript_16779/g.39334  ORF Transcript_16779/g.39334 Transcript_16779/m.39334 type:complete len:274 (+) Transcript_16779:2534-3355(+)
MAFYCTSQDFAGGHVFVRCGVVDKDEVNHVCALLCQFGHAQTGWWLERDVAARPKGTLKAERSLAEGARHGDEVCPPHVLRGAQGDVSLHRIRLAALELEAEVQTSVYTLCGRGPRPDPAHVVHLGQPPERELGCLEEVLEAHTINIFAALHAQAMLVVQADKPVWVSKRAQHKLLRDAHAWLDETRLQPHPGLLPLYSSQHLVVGRALGRVAQRLIRVVDQPDLLLRLLTVDRVLVRVPLKDQPAVTPLDLGLASGVVGQPKDLVMVRWPNI